MSPERFRRDPIERLERKETSEEQRKKVKEQTERLSEFLKTLAERLNSEGVPVTSDCRIKMEAFGSVYDQKKIEKDIKQVNELLSKWRSNLQKEKIIFYGEILEMLKTAIFAKNLGDKFIVVRSSFHDDFKNHVDNIIVDRESGAVVCAVDLVADISELRYKNKIEEVYQRNLGGGATLEYGLTTKEDSGVTLGRVENTPIVYLPLPEDKIRKGLLESIFSLEKQSDYEKKLFDYFLAVIKSQIESLNQIRILNPVLRDRLTKFREAIESRF